MPFSNYDQLVKEVIDYSHRGDLGTKIEGFIKLAENAMYSNDKEVLTVRSMETTTSEALTGSEFDLPVGFESARSVRILTGGGNGYLKFQAPQQMRPIVSTGMPNFFTILGSKLKLDRAPDSGYTLEITYYKKADPLSKDNLTNDVLTEHPSIYLYGSLAQLSAYTLDTEQQIKYSQMFIDAIRGANKADKKGRYGPAPTMSSPQGMRP